MAECPVGFYSLIPWPLNFGSFRNPSALEMSFGVRNTTIR